VVGPRLGGGKLADVARPARSEVSPDARSPPREITVTIAGASLQVLAVGLEGVERERWHYCRPEGHLHEHATLESDLSIAAETPANPPELAVAGQESHSADPTGSWRRQRERHRHPQP